MKTKIEWSFHKVTFYLGALLKTALALGMMNEMCSIPRSYNHDGNTTPTVIVFRTTNLGFMKTIDGMKKGYMLHSFQKILQ